MESPDNASRRDFLANLALAVTILPGAGIAASHVLKFLVPPTEGKKLEIQLGRLADLAVGGSRVLRNVLGHDLVMVRLAEAEVKVFSSVCTHLGCHVHWDQVAGNFLCPCHQGRFDPNGNVIEGPPPKPLPAYPVRIDGEFVYATLPQLEV